MEVIRRMLNNRLLALVLLSCFTAIPLRADPGLIVSAEADNDLVRVLASTGCDYLRVDGPAAAVARAPANSAVMILANGYPQTSTPVDAALFAAAKAKHLRLYVEYPSSLPGLAVGARVTLTYDRAVIQSGFFGAGLAPMRILAIHGLNYLPVNAANAHMVSARVAGFDTAVFGLLGILEAPLSEISPDGSQLQSVIRRGDCHAEAAMAMALGAQLGAPAKNRDVARNLLDLYFFESEARKGGRGDPQHGAYGLTAWGIESGWTQGWIVAVLAMRQMDTSLGDLLDRPGIESTFATLRPQMLPDDAITGAIGEEIRHDAIGAAIELATPVGEATPQRQPRTAGVAREPMLSDVLDGVEARHVRSGPSTWERSPPATRPRAARHGCFLMKSS